MASCPWRGSTLSAGRPRPGRRGVAACRDSEGPGRKRPSRRHRQHPPMVAHTGAGRHQAPTRGPRGRQQFDCHGPAENPGTPPPCTGTRDGTALSPAQVDVLRALLPPTRSRSVGPSSFSATPWVRARHEIRHLLTMGSVSDPGRRFRKDAGAQPVTDTSTTCPSSRLSPSLVPPQTTRGSLSALPDPRGSDLHGHSGKAAESPSPKAAPRSQETAGEGTAMLSGRGLRAGGRLPTPQGCWPLAGPRWPNLLVGTPRPAGHSRMTLSAGQRVPGRPARRKHRGSQAQVRPRLRAGGTEGVPSDPAVTGLMQGRVASSRRRPVRLFPLRASLCVLP